MPRTWLSPEAETCHLRSLQRWMLLAPGREVTAQTHKHTHKPEQAVCILGRKMVHMIPHCAKWPRRIMLSDQVGTPPAPLPPTSRLCWIFMHQISSPGLEMTNYALAKNCGLRRPAERRHRTQPRGRRLPTWTIIIKYKMAQMWLVGSPVISQLAASEELK